jgi:hypothetical protein
MRTLVYSLVMFLTAVKRTRSWLPTCPDFSVSKSRATKRTSSRTCDLHTGDDDKKYHRCRFAATFTNKQRRHLTHRSPEKVSSHQAGTAVPCAALPSNRELASVHQMPGAKEGTFYLPGRARPLARTVLDVLAGRPVVRTLAACR